MTYLEPAIETKMTELANFLIDRALFEFSKSKDNKMAIDTNNQSNIIKVEHQIGKSSYQYAKGN